MSDEHKVECVPEEFKRGDCMDGVVGHRPYVSGYKHNEYEYS